MDLDFAQQLLAAQRAGLALTAGEQAAAEKAVLVDTVRELRERLSLRGERLAGQVAEACKRIDAGYIRNLSAFLLEFATEVDDFKARSSAALANVDRRLDVITNPPHGTPSAAIVAQA